MNYAVLAISPDANKVAFVGCNEECQLYVREPSAIDAFALTGTEGAQSPSFSPDGQWIVFGAKGRLKKVNLTNGTVVNVAEAPVVRGASWGADDTILFSRGGGGILRVSATGGEVQEVTKPDLAHTEYDHRWPHILPGGRTALVEVLHEYGMLNAGSRGHDIAIVNLETGTTRILIEGGGTPKYWGGHVLFGRDGVLYAALIDIERLELIGRPTPVLDGVFMWSTPGENSSVAGNVNYDISSEGTLVFNPREARLPKRTLVLVDRNGRLEPVSSTQQAYSDPQFSPDGRRIAVAVEEDVGSWGTFVIDLASDVWTRVARDAAPLVWMHDGRILLSGRGFLLLASIDDSGPPETLFVGDAGYASIGPEGRVLFSTQAAPGRWDIWRLKISEEPDAKPWLSTSAWEQAPSFSPDGGWVAYHADDSGSFEIHLRPYADAGGRRQISNQGGVFPRWSRDGREIFFLSSSRSLCSAAVRTSPTLASDPQRKLFELSEDIRVGVSQFYDVSPDGQHFVMVQKDPFELRPLDLVVVPGWIEEMKARLASTK